jgi:hypothetical protein
MLAGVVVEPESVVDRLGSVVLRRDDVVLRLALSGYRETIASQLGISAVLPSPAMLSRCRAALLAIALVACSKSEAPSPAAAAASSPPATAASSAPSLPPAASSARPSAAPKVTSNALTGAFTSKDLACQSVTRSLAESKGGPKRSCSWQPIKLPQGAPVDDAELLVTTTPGPDATAKLGEGFLVLHDAQGWFATEGPLYAPSAGLGSAYFPKVTPLGPPILAAPAGTPPRLVFRFKSEAYQVPSTPGGAHTLPATPAWVRQDVTVCDMSGLPRCTDILEIHADTVVTVDPDGKVLRYTQPTRAADGTSFDAHGSLPIDM